MKTSEQPDFRFPTDWSEDGLLFTVLSTKTKTDIWSVRLTPDGNLAPGAMPVAYVQTSAWESSARFAPLFYIYPDNYVMVVDIAQGIFCFGIGGSQSVPASSERLPNCRVVH